MLNAAHLAGDSRDKFGKMFVGGCKISFRRLALGARVRDHSQRYLPLQQQEACRDKHTSNLTMRKQAATKGL